MVSADREQINGIGVDPSNGSVVVGGINTGSGAPVVGIDLDADEYLRPSKRGRTADLLEEAGLPTREVQVAAPAGFRRDTVGALVVEPRRGETPRQTRERVERALEAGEIETTALSASETRGMVSGLGF